MTILPVGISGNINNHLLRPHAVGMTPHEGSVATILLMSNDATNEDSDKMSDRDIDYLNDLTQEIKNIIPETQINNPNNIVNWPQGTIQSFLLDGSHEYYGIFNNFSITSFMESNQEIVKVHQNFSGSWNAFFFGSQPKVYQFSGVFIDSREYPYYQEFIVAYENYLAGRKCIENKMSMKMVYDGKIIDGYILGVSVNGDASSSMQKGFQFTVLVKDFGFIRENVIATSQISGGSVSTERGLNYMSNRFRNKPSANSEDVWSGDQILSMNTDDLDSGFANMPRGDGFSDIVRPDGGIA